MTDDYIGEALRRIERKVDETNAIAQQGRVDIAAYSSSLAHAHKTAEDAHALAAEVKSSHEKFSSRIMAWAASIAFTVTIALTLVKEGLFSAFRS
jgi:hypothetical protein